MSDVVAQPDQRERYDRIAEGYARWWAPVLVDTARRVLDLVADDVEAGATAMLDVGTGTGTLAIAALTRWPDIRVHGIDASDGMLELARREAARALADDALARLDLSRAYADRLLIADAALDVAVSSFVLQLVPSRRRALAEIARVLRPGGRLAYVTWLRGGDAWAPDAILDEELDTAGYGPRDGGGPSGDLASPAAAADGLRRAGFQRVQARRELLIHPFTPEGYLGFVEEFDEEDTFADMRSSVRRRTRERILTRLERLTREELTLRLPVVFATGIVRGRAAG
ncbi:MAG: class I SAM-dependent methyltransferase [Chloroflexota bacterium]